MMQAQHKIAFCLGIKEMVKVKMQLYHALSQPSIVSERNNISYIEATTD